MDSVYIPFIVVLVAVVAIGGRLLSGNLDRTRIRDYLEGQGSQLLDCNWSPFGRGWFGSKEERIYEITYSDAGGNKHQATCKTSMLSGVYFTEDNIVERGEREDPDETEVERLRRENAEMKRRLGQ